MYSPTFNGMHMMKTAASACERLQQSDGNVSRIYGQVLYNAAWFFKLCFCFLLYTLYIVWFQQYSRSSIFVDLLNLTVLSRCRFIDFNSDKIICCQRSYIDEFFILRIVSTTKSMTIGVQGTLMKEQYFVL